MHPTTSPNTAASLASTPRDSGEILQEVQTHHDLVGVLFEELDNLQIAVAPISQQAPPESPTAKDQARPARMSQIGAQLQDDNERLSSAINRLRSIRFNVVI